VKAWHFLAEDKRLGYGDGRLVRNRKLTRMLNREIGA